MNSIYSIGLHKLTYEDLKDWSIYDIISALDTLLYDSFEDSELGFVDVAISMLLTKAGEFYGPTEISSEEVVFVTGWASELEKSRGQQIVGLDGRFFQEAYLSKLKSNRDKISVILEKDFNPIKYIHSVVVAMGTGLSEETKKFAKASVSHPSAVRRLKAHKEVDRKMAQINNYVDTIRKRSQNCIQGPIEKSVAIRKSADSEEKKIVYGVVMGSYCADGIFIDAHGDYIPPSVVEAAAHDYLSKSRTVGLQHMTVLDDSVVVESFIEPYPSKDDYLAAMSGKDHKVSKRTFGDDVVFSGDWILGVKLSDSAWNLYKSGVLNAFSPGGVGNLTKLVAEELPKVTFLENA